MAEWYWMLLIGWGIAFVVLTIGTLWGISGKDIES